MVDILLAFFLGVFCFAIVSMVRELKKDARQKELDSKFSDEYESHLHWIAHETTSNRPGTFKDFLACFEKVKPSITKDVDFYGFGYVGGLLSFPTKVNHIEVLFSGVGFKFSTLHEYAQFRRWIFSSVLEEGNTVSKTLGGSW